MLPAIADIYGNSYQLLRGLTIEAWHAGAVVVVEPVLTGAPVGAGQLGALVDVAGAGGARVARDTGAPEPVHCRRRRTGIGGQIK